MTEHSPKPTPNPFFNENNIFVILELKFLINESCPLSWEAALERRRVGRLHATRVLSRRTGQPADLFPCALRKPWRPLLVQHGCGLLVWASEPFCVSTRQQHSKARGWPATEAAHRARAPWPAPLARTLTARLPPSFLGHKWEGR